MLFRMVPYLCVDKLHNISNVPCYFVAAHLIYAYIASPMRAFIWLPFFYDTIKNHWLFLLNSTLL